MMTKKRVMISILAALLVGALFLGISSLSKKPNQTNKQVATIQKIDKKKTKHKTKKKESKTEAAEQPKEDKQTEVKSEPKKTEDSKAESTQRAESKPVEKSKATETKKTETKKPVCRTETITIPEKGHNEQYLISDEVWEDQPVYEWQDRTFSHDTGEDITGRVSEYMMDLRDKYLAEGKQTHGYYSKRVKIQTGTQRVKVKDAVYGTRWIVDVPAHTETKQVCK